ncbi:MAG: biliverdin-producing heme oxygenase [Hydrogenophaga sp.]|uniref:Biliverdin-producing heme oxygenase n=1 Tax=Hydrogenophaga crocea TaxID=2716225 RepID=A0A6G8IN53_9BURK|nr:MULTISPECIES: biliverdin-producing heme oxygenase [Hydrogenophaga]MBL0943685.1 biliverdin-producing heme oxygenase [Hydrogenophaga sp.]QIM54591.1 biliverdin-producing heme oxygenase [Hydrogenophaga crocea]
MAASEPAAGSLAQRLRTQTAGAHREAERTPLMQALIAGRAGRALYGRLLQQLLLVYEALEPRVAARGQHPWLAGAWSPALARRQALRADLTAFGLGPAAPLPATAAYVERLAAIDGASPQPHARLLAHVYVRHLGDLSGGQILQRVLARAFAGHGSATPAAGLSFYDFGSAEQRDALAQRLRTALAALPAEGAEADAAVDEALWAFEQHLRLFDALGAPA